MAQLSPSAQAYLANKVLSASPEELRLLLLEGAIRFTRYGREGLARKDYEASYTGFSQARNIVMELINSIKPEVSPELCSKISGVYTFIYTLLIEAGHERNIDKADNAVQLLDYERETWVMLMEKLAAERTGAPSASGSQSAPNKPASFTFSA
ncbi:MAG: flagellar export chaperone FliS [Phycisphaerales bacterium]